MKIGGILKGFEGQSETYLHLGKICRGNRMRQMTEWDAEPGGVAINRSLLPGESGPMGSGVSLLEHPSAIR